MKKWVVCLMACVLSMGLFGHIALADEYEVDEVWAAAMDSVDGSYVQGIFEGTLNDSFTTGAELEIEIRYFSDEDGTPCLSFIRRENGGYMTSSPSSQDAIHAYKVVMTDDDGQESGFIAAGIKDHVGKNVLFMRKGLLEENEELTDAEPIVDALKKGGTIHFSIQREDDPGREYLFDVDANGFDQAVENYVWMRTYMGW